MNIVNRVNDDELLHKLLTFLNTKTRPNIYSSVSSIQTYNERARHAIKSSSFQKYSNCKEKVGLGQMFLNKNEETLA